MPVEGVVAITAKGCYTVCSITLCGEANVCRSKTVSNRTRRKGSTGRKKRSEVNADLDDGIVRTYGQEGSIDRRKIPERRDTEWTVKIHQDGDQAIPGIRKTDRNDESSQVISDRRKQTGCVKDGENND